MSSDVHNIDMKQDEKHVGCNTGNIYELKMVVKAYNFKLDKFLS